MNIVHVVESLDIGGLETVVVALARWQSQHADRPRVICLFHEGALAATARAAGIQVDVVGKSRGFDTGALRRLRSLLGHGDIDVLHTHNAVAHYHATIAAIGLRVRRLVNTRHGMGQSRSNRRLHTFYRIALAGTRSAVAVCHAARDEFIRAGHIPARKCIVIPNGVATNGIAARDDGSKRALLAQLGRPADTFVVGIVGRLSLVKDHATLLDAVTLLRRSGRPVDLVVIGDGETREAIEARVRELQLQHCVHMLGMRGDVSRLLPALDAFALVSLSEGYSLALVEAATAALPIVATRVGGNAEIVRDEANGLLVSPGDAAGIAAALARLADDESLRLRMGEAGRAWALRHGSVDAMAMSYRSLYGGAAGGGAAEPTRSHGVAAARVER